PLDRTVIQPVPAWSSDVDLRLQQFACLDVLEDAAQSTASLSCVQVLPPIHMLDITGIRLQKSTLLQVLSAIHEPVFPDRGIVIGMVLDYLGAPLPGISVMTNPPTMAPLLYLDDSRSTAKGTATSNSGIFVSTDATFGT